MNQQMSEVTSSDVCVVMGRFCSGKWEDVILKFMRGGVGGRGCGAQGKMGGVIQRRSR